jgi:radical SAM protein with 4Fe4S-binding SPASM domain
MNLSDLVELKREINPGTKVQVHMTINHEIFKGMKSVEEMIKLCDKIGVDELQVNDLTWSYDYRTSTKKHAIRTNMTKDEVNEIISKMPKTKYTKLNYSIYQPLRRRCHQPWTSIYIDVNGDVFPCTDNLDVNLGNIFKESMNKIFNSKKMNEFRRKSVRGDIKNCEKCILWAKGGCPMFRDFVTKRVIGDRHLVKKSS